MAQHSQIQAGGGAGGTFGVASAPHQLTISDRTSALLQRVSDANNRLEDVLGRLRGHHPSVATNAKDAPQPTPNLDLMLNRLENMLSETEGHISEIARTI